MKEAFFYSPYTFSPLPFFIAIGCVFRGSELGGYGPAFPPQLRFFYSSYRRNGPRTRALRPIQLSFFQDIFLSAPFFPHLEDLRLDA